MAAEASVSGGSRLVAAIKNRPGKSLDEQPATIAALVFDFRLCPRCVAHAAQSSGGCRTVTR
jgi:hypothetical protein